MAIHPDLWSLAAATVEEYLTASKLCLKAKKTDGGILGCPAALLLFCIINALGTYLVGDEISLDGKKQKITRGEPFRVLNHPTFGLSLTNTQIKNLEHWFRNPLAHNAIIEGSVSLVAQGDGQSFLFTKDSAEVGVPGLRKLVEAAWKRFDRMRIKSWVERGK